MRFLNFAFLLLLVTLATSGFAQKNYTLQECIALAIENNLELAVTSNQTLNAEIDWTESKLGMLPTLNGFASLNNNIGRTIDPFTNLFVESQIQNSNISLSSNLLLFQGLQLQNTIKARKKLYLSSVEDLKAAKETLALNISAAFLNALLAEELIKINEQQLAANGQLLKQAEALYEAGAIANVQILDLRAQIASDNLNVINAKNTRQLALVTLSQLMNIPFDPNNGISIGDLESLAVPKYESAEEIYVAMIARAPVIKSTLLREEGAKYSRRAAEGMRSPRLSIGGNINTIYSESFQNITSSELVGSRVLYVDLQGNPVLSPLYVPTSYEVKPFGNQLEENLGRSFGLSLSIPILNGWQVNNNIKRAKIAVNNAKLNTQQAKNRAYQDVIRSYTEYKAAEQTMEAARLSLAARTESYNYARERYQSGALKFADYNLQDAGRLQAETQFARSRYEFLFRAKVLDLYKNGPGEL